MPRKKSSDKQFKDLSQEIDVEKFRDAVVSNFINFPDPRTNKKRIYPAWYLLLIILSGYLSGCDTVSDLAHFAELRNSWLTGLLGNQMGIPSYDTIWWFLVRVKPAAFKELISRWLGSLPSNLQDQLLVIDGKRLRGVSDSEHISHFVELFAADQRIVIAQEKVPEKSDERKALPALLDSIDVRGSLISMDALYAHQTDLSQVLARGADYLVGIKGNQGSLQAEVSNFFEQAYSAGYDGVEATFNETLEKDHGRIELRKICVTHDIDWLPQREEWGLRSLIEVRSERTIKEKVEASTRYYGSSRIANAEQFARFIRSHWSIENQLHYILDVTFDEDSMLANAAIGLTSSKRWTKAFTASADASWTGIK